MSSDQDMEAQNHKKILNNTFGPKNCENPNC